MADFREIINKSAYSGAASTTDEDTFDEDTILQINQIKGNIQEENIKIGFACSSFDLLHVGHITMLEDAKKQCDILVIGVQHDPTLDRPDSKNAPIQSLYERKMMVSSIKHVDYCIEYTTENDLYNILVKLNPDVRILGTDWKGKKYTGHNLSDIQIYWHDRSSHAYSTTNLRKRIYHAEVEKQRN